MRLLNSALQRLPNPLFQAAHFTLNRAEYPEWIPGASPYVARFLRWQLDARLGERVHLGRPEKLTAILPSFRRFRNLEPMVRSMLKADFVERIVVTNNNPEVRIGDWVRLRDPRLRLIDQPRRRPPGIRFFLAREEEGAFFLTLDDDVFLYPQQLKELFLAQLEAPEAPHGVQGEDYVGPGAPPSEKLRGEWLVDLLGKRRVDVLNRVYAFTRAHLDEMYRLAAALDLKVEDIANGEDILLSFCGSARPRLADVGSFGECLTSAKPGVAVSTEDGFHAYRKKLYLELRRLKPELLADEAHR